MVRTGIVMYTWVVVRNTAPFIIYMRTSGMNREAALLKISFYIILDSSVVREQPSSPFHGHDIFCEINLDVVHEYSFMKTTLLWILLIWWYCLWSPCDHDSWWNYTSVSGKKAHFVITLNLALLINCGLQLKCTFSFFNYFPASGSQKQHYLLTSWLEQLVAYPWVCGQLANIPSLLLDNLKTWERIYNGVWLSL